MITFLRPNAKVSVLLMLFALFRSEHFGVRAFSATSMKQRSPIRLYAASTVEAPTRPDTDRKTGRRSGNEKDDRRSNDNDDDIDYYKDLEYYIDPSVSREMNEPFHILLIGSVTFARPKITVEYVSRTLEYVLGLPYNDAVELSQFAKEHMSMACLGTWTREQCLQYGTQLQQRDVSCRVVPYCPGGQRGWQAKDASSYSSSNSEQ
jgi:hypothetical protein